MSSGLRSPLKRFAKSIQRGVGIPRGPRFECNNALIVGPMERAGNCRVINLACAGFLPPGYIRNLYLYHPRQEAKDALDEVSFIDLCVVDVIVEAKSRAADLPHEPSCVLGARERGAGMIDPY